MTHSKLADIHPDAKIGKNVRIEPFAIIKGNTVIEDGCWIGAHAVIWEGARLGKNVSVYPGASISSIPQDLKYAGEETETFVGDNTSIREYVTISRGTANKEKTVVGKNCLLMAYVHVAHDCIVGDNCIIANAVQLGGHVHIGDWGFIGGCSGVHQFVRMGAHAMVAARTMVRKDVPPYATVAREPLVYVGVNKIGLKRRGFSHEKVYEIENIYRFVFSKGMNYSEALEAIESQFPSSSERDYIINFIRDSERGIVRGVSVDSTSLEE